MSLRPAQYNTLEILGSDGRTIDIRLAVTSFDYYEDLLVPTVTAKLQVINSGGSVEDEQGENVSLYEGLKLRGGEAVRILITPVGPVDTETIDWTLKPLYINSIGKLNRGSQKEFFEISLVSREAIENETSFVQRTFKKEQSIAEHATSILREDFTDANPFVVDPTAPPNLGFNGNQMSPFECLMMLASKAIPSTSSSSSSSGSGASAGYFFYQTRDGHQFRSIDGLISQQPKATYYYSEINESSLTQGEGTNQYRINYYDIHKNQNVVDMLQKGAYSTDRRFFNPLDFKVQSPKENAVFSGQEYIEQGAKNLGDFFNPNELKLSDASLSFTSVPSQIISETIDIGTFDVGRSFDLNADKQSYVSQAKMRYNTLFTQVVSMQVPLNTSLRAGDIIKATFPKIKTCNTRGDIDQGQVSGLYMIKEICHHTDPRGSYTSMMIIRDTYGLNGTNNSSSQSTTPAFPTANAPIVANPTPFNLNLLDGAF